MSIIKEYYPYIRKDINDVLEYVFPAVLVGIILGGIVFAGYRIVTHKWNLKKLLVYFLFGSYVSTVVQIAYLSRQPGSRTDVAFGLWDTWGTTIQAHAYVVENIMMYIPFGMLFPLLGKYPRLLCIPVAACSSIVLEGMQYISQRGFCQLDDVITNIIGTCIGYLIFNIICLIKKVVK